MQLEVTETGVRADAWSAPWLDDVPPFRKLPVKVLAPWATGLATLTDADVAYYLRHGRWPGYDRIALNPAWGFPEPAADGTTDRRMFHMWRTVSKGFAGRPLVLTYDDVVEIRRSRSFKSFNNSTAEITYETYRGVARGATYWWVQAGDPSWAGWGWTNAIR
jgi:hypothetical protein